MPPAPRSPLLTSKEIEQMFISRNARSDTLECSLDLQVSTSTIEIGPIDWAWNGRRFPYPERFKDRIKPMNHASETILALQPVTFFYKKNIDPKGTPQFGLVAEQVEKVNPDLVVRDANGKVFSVRYDAVNAMLLNEFLREHKRVEELEANAVEQRKEIKALIAGLKKQAAQIQKVSDRVELKQPAAQLVGTNQ